MSQAGANNSSSPTPGGTLILEADSSVQVSPNGSDIIFVEGLQSQVNNDAGIETDGNAGASEFYVILTNRATSTVNTANATPTTLQTFALGATPGTYFITAVVGAYNTTDTAGASYEIKGAFRTDGATATQISFSVVNSFEEAAMVAADAVFTTSANNVIVQVTGIAAKTIHWDSLLTFRFVS